MAAAPAAREKPPHAIVRAPCLRHTVAHVTQKEQVRQPPAIAGMAQDGVAIVDSEKRRRICSQRLRSAGGETGLTGNKAPSRSPAFAASPRNVHALPSAATIRQRSPRFRRRRPPCRTAARRCARRAAQKESA